MSIPPTFLPLIKRDGGILYFDILTIVVVTKVPKSNGSHVPLIRQLIKVDLAGKCVDC